MHTRDLAELAARVAVMGPALIRRSEPVSEAANQAYWAASRCRLDRWSRLLRRLADAQATLPRPAPLAWVRIRPVLEEILVGELLARIWGAYCRAADQIRGRADLEPVAQNILVGHQEARRRLLQLLAAGDFFDVSEATALNHLRQRVERWCDMLLAHLAIDVEIADFAFEPERAEQFAADLDVETVATDRKFTGQLVVAALRGAFETCLAEANPNRDLNARLGNAVLDSLITQPGEHATHTPSIWVERLANLADDAQGMVDELLRIDDELAVQF
jgi:hypothetical protein